MDALQLNSFYYGHVCAYGLVGTDVATVFWHPERRRSYRVPLADGKTYTQLQEQLAMLQHRLDMGPKPAVSEVDS
jgi:hypothetical protein